ncbi:hypothetical protein AV530_017682 [Patagioenas fasciata monilis]|uniref:Uncharacterized protein n=1 Tax=Patagioenas fasciata monilis TaxID=372326 RepID=A0A1V4JT17_PATFA|nr:hypothetical protein AV530_017682 [Patagioenas fasciata monilis]
MKPQRSGGSLPKLVAAPESVKLPKFGGSSPDIRGVGVAKTLRRGGSAESLVLAAGRKGTEAPVPPFTGLAAKRRERSLDGKTPKPLKVPALELVPPGMDEKEAGERFGVKLPKFGGVSVKEKRGGEQGDPGRNVNGEAQAKLWRWVPKVGFAPPEPTKARPKVGSPPKPRFPDVEICAEVPVSPKLHLGGPGTPKFQLPKVVLSPQPCEW